MSHLYLVVGMTMCGGGSDDVMWSGLICSMVEGDLIPPAPILPHPLPRLMPLLAG